MTKKTRKSGTAKQKLAAQEKPVARHDAERLVEDHVVMHADMTTIESKAPEADACRPAHSDAVVPASPTSPASTAVAADLFEQSGGATPSAATVPPAAGSPRRPASAEAVQGTLGQRLRAAREGRGWSIGDVGSRLRLPVQIIQALEAEHYDKIGYGIYLRSYLNSYARLVDVPTVLVDPVVRERAEAPPLVASGTISHSRYLYQRYSVSALYLILTGVIIVPAVLLAMRASLQPNVGELAALDAPPPPVSAGAPAHEGTASPQQAANGAPAPATAAAPVERPVEAPFVASLAPFAALTRKDPAAAHAETPAVGSHTLKLSLKEASWVEVTSAGGEKLEYGLLPAGSVRTYTSDKALEVRLGNCNGAEVETDGTAQDLAPYRHSNVARFRLFSAGEAISRTDS